MKIIYTDNNATTMVAPEVIEAMAPYLAELYYNPSSTYDAAHITGDAIKEARKDIAEALGTNDSKEILFTSCATESNNTAIFGAAKANRQRKHIITSSVEHPAVLEVCKQLEREGYQVTYIPVDTDGNLDIPAFIRALDSDTLMVTIMHANNETGIVFPIEQLSRLTKETDPAIIFHTDATQTIGKLPINLKDNFKHIDLMSFSGHKFHAPKGIGALFIRRGTPCRPLLIGGHQEEGRRGGTENVAYIVGLARALKLILAHRDEDEERIEQLRDRLETSLEKMIPFVQINGKHAPRLPNTLNISSHYIEGEGMLYQLSGEGICASSGSACTSGSLEPSHVLRSMNIPFTAVHGSIRFSLSRYNTDEEIDRIIEVFPRIVSNLRNLSPYWDKQNNRPRPNADKMFQEVH
ncbi:MAG: cysteine desulfurase NifS [Candidatus Eisenbacteria bacterium]|uniref:Cysteine desulfurase n=1 Tax=Eiseniibacteriota bacterium TaxID=2212470 RepID=A0A948RU93_UNCEI|nr:cysteine desulfurase NifS [Candidatus Eisenbacteria bacterium]MBU1950081.1 cysteine desulfurase NifS [Candidatus Eisenbacteria bacterium]MBU2690990.1 cysteine desulfurase NifS [Candidatus Eisenbacteria bacterium]